MQILIKSKGKVINKYNNKKIKNLPINLLTNRINSKTIFKFKKMKAFKTISSKK